MGVDGLRAARDRRLRGFIVRSLREPRRRELVVPERLHERRAAAEHLREHGLFRIEHFVLREVLDAQAFLRDARARVHGDESRDRLEERALPRAVHADDADLVARGEAEVDA